MLRKYRWLVEYRIAETEMAFNQKENPLSFRWHFLKYELRPNEGADVVRQIINKWTQGVSIQQGKTFLILFTIWWNDDEFPSFEQTIFFIPIVSMKIETTGYERI